MGGGGGGGTGSYGTQVCLPGAIGVDGHGKWSFIFMSHSCKVHGPDTVGFKKQNLRRLRSWKETNGLCLFAVLQVCSGEGEGHGFVEAGDPDLLFT